ncbi:LysR family transcriptional regulator [Acidisoma cellulosilytica]|uniref:LysR family transcriptional regulator n=1 Tax=Acidisoma cellulosilyticum TaxID=2802395 RepID=A0A963Z148_9PROT|nr:LysR family transcriptional regulator [Acidisoma cellulosilyticum]MCB8880599.1 LysR family transcriptional regulator [Acidisoma cellulosilyticum]
MIDLNDYAYFAAVVRHGGFAPAGRALRLPKSKLSRRIAGLETRLGVRLIERSTRRFRVTETGDAFYARCRTILSEMELAEAIVAEGLAEPHGLVRFACPTGLVGVLAPYFPAFLNRYPKVRLQIWAVDRPVDLIEERIDVALRVRLTLESDAALTMRSLGISRRILVASPNLARGIGQDIAALATLPVLGTGDDFEAVEWLMESTTGETRRMTLTPRMSCGDFTVVRQAALAGIGVALLPDHVVTDWLASGQLVQVLPDWRGPPGTVHLVFTTRRGLPPAVRAFIDHLARTFPAEVASR